MNALADDDARPFPRNAWYAAAWSSEVGRALLARTLCGQPLVLYRRTDGSAAALEDACWHRLLPLSRGRLDGDRVVCGYHGLVFDPSGRCVFMPSQRSVHPSACVRSYPTAQRHGFVWVWMGDPTLAAGTAVPDLHQGDDPAWTAEGERLHLRCDYRLVVDNLMDLTHETFVHAGSIGGRDVAEAPFAVTHREQSVTVTRWMTDVDPPSFWAAQLGAPGRVDRWQIIHFQPPCTVAIDVGVAPAGSGAPGGDRSRGVNGYVLNTITPESETSCHYFWAFARNYRIQDRELSAELRSGVARIFEEDRAVLEAQQQALERSPRRAFYNLNIDAGAVWARRLIERRLAAERAAERRPSIDGQG